MGGSFLSSSLLILFLAAGYFLFKPHDTPCLTNCNTPTMPTIEPNHHVAAALYP